MKTMKTADFHCDVLWRLLEDGSLNFSDDPQGKLDVTLPRLKRAGSVFQTFAVYVPERMDKTMIPILRSIDLFHRKVLSAPGMSWVRSAGDAGRLLDGTSTGALLSLEGADGLQGDMAMLRVLFHLGVRAVGLTWNHANWGADGVMEPRRGGLTAKGRDFVKECNNLGILLDVSHLSERGFWEMADVSEKPIIASHSNSRAVCPHPRNLTDEQLKAIIEMDGLIGITFVPQFVRTGGQVGVDGLLPHIERVCELGGEKQLMFGSDFDGIDTHIQGLSHPGELESLEETLVKTYTAQQVESFFAGNAIRFLTMHLPG